MEKWAEGRHKGSGKKDKCIEDRKKKEKVNSVRKSWPGVNVWRRHKVETAIRRCAAYLSARQLPVCGWFMLFFHCDCKVYFQLWGRTQSSQVSKLNCLLPSLPQHTPTLAAKFLFFIFGNSYSFSAAHSCILPMIHAALSWLVALILLFSLWLPYFLATHANISLPHWKMLINSPSPLTSSSSSSSASTVMWGHSWEALWFDSSVFMW